MPLLAIPTSAICSINRVNFDLKLTEKNKAKFADFLNNQIQITLKDDFLDLYLRSDYEEVMRKRVRHDRSSIGSYN
jgi:hypothetical protein